METDPVSTEIMELADQDIKKLLEICSICYKATGRQNKMREIKDIKKDPNGTSRDEYDNI